MKIALIGDIAPIGRFCLHAHPAVLDRLEAVRRHLAQFDLVIGNLETPLTLRTRAVGGKSATLKAHPDNVALLTHLGVSHVSLANNHMGDYGDLAYQDTTSCLGAAGIQWFGTEGKRIDIDAAGEKICLLGYCSHNTNPARLRVRGASALNYLGALEVAAAVRSNAERGYLSVLAVHSGQEHVHAPSLHDVVFARGLAEIADYVYCGHHPHVVQGHERVGGSAIFYSLGNFLFDDVYTRLDPNRPLIRLSAENKTGIIASITVSKGRIVGTEVTPLFLDRDRVLVGTEVRGFSMATYDSILNEAGSPGYERQRAVAIREFLQSRRKLRNIRWYLRRVNPNSIGIIVNALINLLRYRRQFASRLPLVQSSTPNEQT